MGAPNRVPLILTIIIVALSFLYYGYIIVESEATSRWWTGQKLVESVSVNLEEATEIVKNGKGNALFVVYDPDCSTCRDLYEVLDEEIGKNRFVVAPINIRETPDAFAILDNWEGRGSGLKGYKAGAYKTPTWIFFNREEKDHGVYIGLGADRSQMREFLDYWHENSPPEVPIPHLSYGANPPEEGTGYSEIELIAEDRDIKEFIITTEPKNGKLEAIDVRTGKYRYYPTTTENGEYLPDTLKYKVVDEKGNESEILEVEIRFDSNF